MIPDDCELAGNDIIPVGGDGIPDDCNCLVNGDCAMGETCDPCTNVCEGPAGCSCGVGVCRSGPNANLPCTNSAQCPGSQCKSLGCVNSTPPPGMVPICPEDNACNCQSCEDGTCVVVCVKFGNVTCDAGNIVNLDDILCVLAGFSSLIRCPDADINPCGGNGLINLADILDTLNAFGGANPCGCHPMGMPPGGPSLCGSISP
jgi:hypothetical protein